MTPKRIALLAGIAVLVALAAFGGWLHAQLGGGADRIDLGDGIVGVYDGTAYSYVLRRDDKVVLVDAGNDPAGTAILAELERQGLGPDAVRAILVTHGHWDHFAAAHLFPRATVRVGADDHPLLRGDRAPPGALPRLAAHVLERPPRPERIRPVLPGEIITAGNRAFLAVALPGHTPGTMAYRHRDTLFIGDALVLDGTELSLPPRLFSASARRMHEVIERLRALDFVRIADGHYGVANDGRVRLDRWLERNCPAATCMPAP